jgi:hypothetical protein
MDAEERFKQFFPAAELQPMKCPRRPYWRVVVHGGVYSDSPIGMSCTPKAAWESALRKVRL